jgi:membrane-bound lytic murein transglycosylase D
MKHAAAVLLLAFTAGCAVSPGPESEVAPVAGTTSAAPATAAAPDATASHDARPGLLPPAPVVNPILDSIIDAEIAAELQLEADSAADAAVLAQLNGGEAPGDASATPTDEVASGSTVTWDFDVSTYGSHERVQYWIDFFQGPARERFQIWLTRLPKYEPMIRQRLKEQELPTDLVYLALIESGLSNHAVSHASAVGMWQFMRGTGRDMGLRIDGWVDERRDPVKATAAATRYLAMLHKRFGSLYLAAAAYNAGGGRVSRSIKRLPDEPVGGGDTEPTDDELTEAAEELLAEAEGTEPAAEEAEAPVQLASAPKEAAATGYSDATFFRLYDTDLLHRETRDYVPKLIAAALLAKEPARYGFSVPSEVRPLAYDSLVVQGLVGLDVVARLADTSLAALRELNPQYLRLVTPPDARSVIRLPVGRGERTSVAYAELPPSKRVSYVTHVVKRGQTLSGVARSYGVSQGAIRDANSKLARRKYLRAGEKLIIPTSGRISPVVARSVAEEPAERGRSSRPVFHRVKRGESISVIAQRYEITQKQLRSWNKLGRGSRIIVGQKLRIAAPGTRGSAAADDAPRSRGTKVAARGAKSGRTIKSSAGASVAKAKVKSRTHVVKRGETLTGIASRYDVTLRELAKANGIRTTTRIQAGKRLRIPT